MDPSSDAYWDPALSLQSVQLFFRTVFAPRLVNCRSLAPQAPDCFSTLPFQVNIRMLRRFWDELGPCGHFTFVGK